MLVNVVYSKHQITQWEKPNTDCLVTQYHFKYFSKALISLFRAAATLFGAMIKCLVCVKELATRKKKSQPGMEHP